MHGYRAIRVCLFVTIMYSLAMFSLRLPAKYFIESRLVIVITFLILLGNYFIFRILALPALLSGVFGCIAKGKIRIAVTGENEHFQTLRKLCRKSAIYRKHMELIHVSEPPPGDRAEWIDFHVKMARELGTNDLCICDDEASFGDFAVSAWTLRQEGLYVSFFSKIFQNLGYYDPWLSTTKRAAKVFFTDRIGPFGEFLWRFVDIVVAALALLVLSPVLLLVGLAIKLESRGPVLFLQNRVGKDMEEFCFPKFRSMTHDPHGKHEKAHKKYFEKYANGHAAHEEEEHGFKLRNESRITRVGKLLRRTSMDELPQLWCVLTGKMSLVGPRPCIPYELEHYEEWHKLRFSVKPGLTGVWQVYGRSRLPMDASQFMDFSYVMNRSIGVNVRLILKTFPVMLLGKGGV